MLFMSLWALAAALVTAPARAADTGGFVDTAPGVRIHYLAAGTAKPGEPTLLLVPGWHCTAAIWRKQLDDLSASYRIIAVDPRSQGLSTITAEGNTPEMRADDLHALMQSLGLHDVVLVGWSQGVQDVAAYLIRHGDGSLRGVVLVDSHITAGPAEVELHPQFVENVLGGIGVYTAHPQEYAEGMFKAIIKSPLPPEALERLVQDSMRTPTDVGASMLITDMFAVDRREAEKHCRKPVLMIASAESPLLEAERQTAAGFAQGHFVAIADAAHAVFFDQPQVFDKELRAFVAGLPAG